MGTFEFAQKYSPVVDEKFRKGSKTDALVNQNYDFIGVKTVKVYSRASVTLNDYNSTSGTSRYGTPENLTGQTQELTITKDRSFTAVIDRIVPDDGMFALEAGGQLADIIDQQVLPEIDTYRINAIKAGAPSGHVENTDVATAGNAYGIFLALQEMLNEDNAPQVGRIAICTPTFYTYIKRDDSFVRYGDLSQQMKINGQVGTVDGVPLVCLPSSYFSNTSSSVTDLIITNPIACVAPVKLTEYKIHTDAPGISGALIEGRFRYDAFILDQKVDAIAVNTHA